MFGHVVVDWSRLNESEKKRYQAIYCGLCLALGKRHGQLSRFALTYDMAFLILLLTSLYEPKETETSIRCIPHPLQARNAVSSEATAYAADMSILLVYQKCMDDWQDDHAIHELAYAGVLKDSYRETAERYPRQAAAVEKCMDELRSLEKQADSAGACSASFGRLMGELFVWQEDMWSKALRYIGQTMGQLIYLLDAAVDYEDDIRKHSFNPLPLMKLTPEEAKPTLMMLAGQATQAFEKLPLEKDLPLLRNILYSGIWQRYQKAVNGCGKDGSIHGTGPVSGTGHTERCNTGRDQESLP